VVNLNNHIRDHFKASVRRQARHLLESRGVTEARTKFLIHKMLTAFETDATLAAPVDAREDLTQMLEDTKREATSQHLMLKRMFESLKVFEERQEKTFSLVPLYTYMAKYVTIDTNALYGLLGSKLRTGVGLQEFANTQNIHWARVFKLPRARLSPIQNEPKKMFDYMIKTDGVGASVVCCKFVTRSPEMDPRTRENTVSDCLGNDRVWVGIDPGSKSIVTAAKERAHIGYSLSNKQYYNG
jgi:hypothetical protein